MPLSEKNRHAMYEYFVAELGEETASEMLSYFPARDAEEPVTKEVLRSEFALARLELHEGLADLRTEMHSEITGLRMEMSAEFRSQLRWMIGSQVAILGVVVTLIVALT